MAKSSEIVAKLVQQKLEDYFNRQRVENEFDPSGKGIHSTTTTVVQLELSYLQAAEQQWKENKKKKKHRKNGKAKTTDMTDEQELEEDGQHCQSTEGEAAKDGNEATPKVSPRVTQNSRIKSRVKGSEIDRITQNAQTALDQVSVDKIQSVHRYRPHLIPSKRLDMIKVARVSHHVDAILNTEYALDCADENDDREAAIKYAQEKNDPQPERKERDHREDKPQTTKDNGSRQKRTPLWLRVEMERAQKEANSDVESLHEQTREDKQSGSSLDEHQEMTGDREKETKKEAEETREVTAEEKDLSGDRDEMVREDDDDETKRDRNSEDNAEMREDARHAGNETTENPSDGNSDIKTCSESEREVHEWKTEGEPLNDSPQTCQSIENEQSWQDNEEINLKQKQGKSKTKHDLPKGDLQNDSIEEPKMKVGDGDSKVRGAKTDCKPTVDGIGQQGSSEGSLGRGEAYQGQGYRTEVYVRSESVVSLTDAVRENEQKD